MAGIIMCKLFYDAIEQDKTSQKASKDTKKFLYETAMVFFLVKIKILDSND